MATITVCAASPSNGTPLFVPATEAVRALVAQADTDQVEIDWGVGVTLTTITPDSVTTNGDQVQITGVILILATAHTVEANG